MTLGIYQLLGLLAAAAIIGIIFGFWVGFEHSLKMKGTPVKFRLIFKEHCAETRITAVDYHVNDGDCETATLNHN